MNKWFEVDPEGFAKIVARKSKAFIVYELLQNAWDETGVTEVSCNLKMVPHKQLCKIYVEDDSPDGFCNLRHAFVLFAESYKKNDPTKRGRFDLGEKLVLTQCIEASILSTTGGVKFLRTGERKTIRKKRDRGSIFDALVKITKGELSEINQAVLMLIPPENIKTRYNGYLLKRPDIVAEFIVSLPTVISDAEGNLKKTVRKTKVEIYKPKEGNGWIYEMGIPIVETNDRFHVNVMQKVPLNMDRDNVTPSYLRTIRTEVLNNTIDLLDEDDINETWVKEGVSDERCNDDVVIKTLDKKYGKRRVIFDPSDPEANKKAMSEGYTVIPGKSLSKAEWVNVKRAGAAKPAGQVTPSDKIHSSSDGVLPINWDDLTTKQQKFLLFIASFGKRLLGSSATISAKIIILPTIKHAAWYGRGNGITFNLSVLGKKFFNNFPDNIEEVINLCIHEFAHHYESDHLSKKYYRALSALGAKATMVAYHTPSFFETTLEKVTL